MEAVVTETIEAPAPADLALSLIDRALADILNVNIVEAQVMSDLLLDIRLAVADLISQISG